MEEDPGFGCSRKNFAWNSSDWSKPNMWFNLGNSNIGCLPFPNTIHAAISTDHISPFDGFPDLPYPQMNQSGEHLGWFYGLPRHCQAFAPAMRNVPLKDGLSVSPSGTRVKPGMPYEGFDVSGLPKFFVVDQSGNQATLIFGPETNRVRIPHIPIATPKLLGTTAIGDEDQGRKTASKGRDENEDVNTHSEMREDTEELNALLYSEEESDFWGDGDDDEVTSTGHSPSTMTDHLNCGDRPSNQGSEEVASSLWPPCKKRKLTNVCHDSPPFADSSEAENWAGNFDSDDAISSSGDCGNISQNRVMKWANMYETISILQSLVPGVKGKNPVEVLDEVITYLKSQKLKAAALGLGQIEKNQVQSIVTRSS